MGIRQRKGKRWYTRAWPSPRGLGIMTVILALAILPSCFVLIQSEASRSRECECWTDNWIYTVMLIVPTMIPSIVAGILEASASYYSKELRNGCCCCNFWAPFGVRLFQLLPLIGIMKLINDSPDAQEPLRVLLALIGLMLAFSCLALLLNLTLAASECSPHSSPQPADNSNELVQVVTVQGEPIPSGVPIATI